MQQRNDATLESLPSDVLGYLFSFSQNPAAMFYVSKATRQGVVKFMQKHESDFIRLNAGEICYIVYRKASQEITDQRPLPCVDGKEVLMYETIRRPFSDGDMQEIRDKFAAPSSCRLSAMVAEKDMQQNVIYIVKSDNGISYSIQVQGSARMNGEITFDKLPLLECLAKKPFAISHYEPMFDRIAAILRARKHIDIVRKFPIFKDQKDAEAYAKSQATSLFEDCPVIHECQVTQNLVLPREPEEPAINMAYAHKSDVTLTGRSLPCNTEGVMEITSKHKKCSIM